LNWPVKWQEYTSNNNNTSEEESETLSEAYFSIPFYKTSVDEGSYTGDNKWEPKCLEKVDDDREVHIVILRYR
jgi:hypothetical protein